MNKEKATMSVRVAEKFCELDQESKSFISGYMYGKMEERARWERDKYDKVNASQTAPRT